MLIVFLKRCLRLGLGQKKSVHPSKYCSLGTLDCSIWPLEDARQQINTQPKEKHCKHQTHDANVWLFLIVRQTIGVQKIETTREANAHPTGQHHIVGEKGDSKRRSQFGGAEKLQGGSQLQESHHYFHAVQPTAGFGKRLEQTRHHCQDKKRGGKCRGEGQTTENFFRSRYCNQVSIG